MIILGRQAHRCERAVPSMSHRPTASQCSMKSDCVELHLMHQSYLHMQHQFRRLKRKHVHNYQ